MARPRPGEIAKEHGLKIGTIADLIHYRIQNEKQWSGSVLRFSDRRPIPLARLPDQSINACISPSPWEKSPRRSLVRVHGRNLE